MSGVSANAIETLDELIERDCRPIITDAERKRGRDAVDAVKALLEAAKAHLTHTDGFCVDKDDEADLTCPTHRALAAAVRRVESGQ